MNFHYDTHYVFDISGNITKNSLENPVKSFVNLSRKIFNLSRIRWARVIHSNYKY